MSLLLIVSLSFEVQGQNAPYRQEVFGAQAKQIVPGASMVALRPGTSFPSMVRMDSDYLIPAGEFESFLRRNFNFSSDYEFGKVLSRDKLAGKGMTAYQLIYRGIPLEHAMILAHSRNGMVVRFGGFADYPHEVPVSPVITVTEALDLALASTGARTYMWEVPEEEAFLKTHLEDPDATYLPAGELILVRDKASGVDGAYRLAWQFEIRDAESILDRKVFIDAMNGEVIKWYSLVYDCNLGSVPTTWHGTRSIYTAQEEDGDYILLDDCSGTSIHTILEAGNADITDYDNNWSEAGLTDYATTHYYAGVIMDYYQNVHSRSSYDGSGGDMVFRHVASWANGQWIGSGIVRIGMNTGNQGEFYNTLDVVGHEFTHGVTEHNGLGGLTYQGESGALNESYSDILGETAEMWYENGAYTVDWLHREDYTGGANRSLINPNAGGQPDTYLGTNWAPTGAGDPDYGGVHTNSGVMNFWFYLACEGGSGSNDIGDEYSVTGLGAPTMREIVYRMLTEEMTSGATYADARNAAINVTREIYGDCSPEVKQVTNAWYAVGVGNPYCEAVPDSPAPYGGYNISCNGASDGVINLTMLGTAPFTIIWDDGATTQNLTGLAAGTYGVTVTDATGCSDSSSITLTEPDALIALAEVTSDYNGYAVSCFGSSDGEATASATGGVLPYEYLWDAGAGSQTTAVATSLAAGTYEVTVTDANGCTASASVTLNEPPQLVIEAGPNQTVYYGYPPAACATLSYSGVDGGVSPYSYLWSTGESTQDIDVCPLVSTLYTITVTDANGCTATDKVIVCVIDVRCGNKLNKVTICHYPPDDPSNPQTLCVSANAVADHLSHGDMLAACGTDHSCTELKRSVPLSDAQDEDNALDLSVRPNPFTSTTFVTFSTGTDGQAILRLIDFMGRPAGTLFDEPVEKNTAYEVVYNEHHLAPGMYYLMLMQSDGEVRVLKLIRQD